MNETVKSLLEQLKKANAQTRIVMAAGAVLLVAIVGFSMWRSANPSMSLLYPNIDKVAFGRVTAALAQAGVRFEDSGPHPPYSVWVADADRAAAMQAIHGQGALEGTPTGIQTGTGGAASAFLGQAERDQIVQKRRWEEARGLLEAVSWVRAASLMTSPARGGPFKKDVPETVSVMLALDGIEFPDREQSQMVARIVRNAFGVPDENVVISDSRGRRIFDGSREGDMDHALEYELGFQRSRTLAAQRFLDETFGPGMAKASVTGEFDHQMLESIDESMNASKFLLTEETSKTETPISSRPTAGGPASTASGAVGASSSPAADSEIAKTQESRKEYMPARKTTYLKQTQPSLLRMTVSLVLDESLEHKLEDATEALKGVVGFNPERGDFLHAMVQQLPGIERDENGLPIAQTLPEPAPSTNPMISMLLERGVEIVAALAFLFLLFKTLKKSGSPVPQPETAGGPQISDEELDMDALARRHVEELVQTEPEKVGALLSRWALGEDYYMKSSR